MNDYFEQQKAEPQIEIELNVNRWVIISIGYRGSDCKTADVILYTYTLSIDMSKKYSYVFRWRAAKLQCKHPKEYICIWQSHFDKNTSLRLDHDSLYSKVIRWKGLVTRAKNIIKKYEDERLKTLFHDFENDPIWLDAQVKLQQRVDGLAKLQAALDKALAEYNNKKTA
ncbi:MULTISPECIES: hypothetical protein [Dysgonomonas]|uniref:hypothetical protein n=1 Tax=Dysgonomonas TaxID=156973 RepID=UPI0009269002|nr:MULTISPECIES: hypothetical protein [Dysgonomonas]MBN9300548.1 hypothetical protein [Dysgonomonas mossii]OJX56129.1 MAG: hypothetical protein BGO84_07615 [Dysgonomonas sp. 37-18]